MGEHSRQLLFLLVYAVLQLSDLGLRDNVYVLACADYAPGSWLVWTLQIHDETISPRGPVLGFSERWTENWSSHQYGVGVG